jgi:uncharacterized membrane protein YfcA
MDLSATTWTLAAALGLVGLGLGIGAYGTLIGAGGGFLLVPVLLLLDSQQSPATVTAMSLVVVFFNAYSGSWTYARMGRIDFSSGTLFAMAAVPGAILGTWVVRFLPTTVFAVVFSVALLLAAVYLFWQPMPHEGRKPTRLDRFLEEAGNRRLAGSISSAYVGLLSSMLGIGGGIIHVPVLIRLLSFPPHIATATSHFVLAITTFFATAIHLGRGQLDDVILPTALLALGVMLGTPLGATVSSLVRGPLIVRLLAAGLVLAACRLIWRLCV